MINNPYQTPAANIQFTWQAIIWRLLLTALLLLILAASSLTIFSPIALEPDTRALPTLTPVIEKGGILLAN